MNIFKKISNVYNDYLKSQIRDNFVLIHFGGGFSNNYKISIKDIENI